MFAEDNDCAAERKFMRIPVLRGLIDRRILVNFRLDPEAVKRVLPAPFRPKLVKGYAMGGICLIRIKEVRPRLLPGFVGIGSENGALRFSVQWDQDGEVREGVYIPRRVTNSRLNTLVGGRLFPGVHHHARFDVNEAHPYYQIALESDDGLTRLTVKGTARERLPESSLFSSVEEASEFFRAGSLGYSDTRTPGLFDGLELRSFHWKVAPLDVSHVECNLFSDTNNFPPGSAEFECALLMRGIEHEWHGRESLRAPEPLRCAA
jgi:hypothetical protein